MDLKNDKYKILLTGGGTGGSAAPLLAIHDELRDRGDFEFLWLGTKSGPERAMVESAGIEFRAICGGKWRRYFSLENLSDIFKIKLGFFQAFWIILKWRPNLIISAGSFISVPAVWAGWFLRVPMLIHQQDVRPGLANKLMAPLAKAITVTFEKSLADYGKKAVWIGNPVRQSLKVESRLSSAVQAKGEKLIAKNPFDLSGSLPIVLIVGGGTGAMAINKLVAESLNELTKFCQVVHITGKGKESRDQRLEIRNYERYEFLDTEKMAEAMALADVVVTRAGLGFLSELSYLGKPSIIIPLPDSHQLENVGLFKDAAVVLEQKDLPAEKFAAEIKKLIENKGLRKELGEKMGRVMKTGANQAMVKIILGLLK